MSQSSETIRAFYDHDVQTEWNRLETHRFEFDINRFFISKYVKPGQKVLDCGGGPGRYSLWLSEIGCDVTLFDLSSGNVAFAKTKAQEIGLPLRALSGDARDLSALSGEHYDHILLMGPLYHLLDEADRKAAVNACMELLKPHGTLSVSFISSYAGIIYYLREMPQAILEPSVQADYHLMKDDLPFAGMAFTDAYFARRQDILPFMEQFSLKNCICCQVRPFLRRGIARFLRRARKHIRNICALEQPYASGRIYYPTRNIFFTSDKKSNNAYLNHRNEIYHVSVFVCYRFTASCHYDLSWVVLAKASAEKDQFHLRLSNFTFHGKR